MDTFSGYKNQGWQWFFNFFFSAWNTSSHALLVLTVSVVMSAVILMWLLCWIPWSIYTTKSFVGATVFQVVEYLLCLQWNRPVMVSSLLGDFTTNLIAHCGSMKAVYIILVSLQVKCVPSQTWECTADHFGTSAHWTSGSTGSSLFSLCFLLLLAF